MDNDGITILVDDPEYKISKTKLSGLFIFERKLFSDERGFYQEFARIPAIEDVLQRKLEIKQWAISYNKPGVLRGIHAETHDKVITPVSGKIFIAISDLRPESETFGQYQSFSFDLSDPYTPKKSLIVSEGLGNSFLVLGNEPCLYFYAVTEIYKATNEKRAVRWNDPDINIKWPEEPKIISEDDNKNHPFLRELFPEKFSAS